MLFEVCLKEVEKINTVFVENLVTLVLSEVFLFISCSLNIMGLGSVA